ncbi:hypothetical protein BO94DRAFT_587925 [Aspergillus sclerotioniger CBS 115572]|uniref:Uncharacterized protein n=1 Tax=Aspergillus sclerotioniger CBS 115572 TaxID=1450535 RepID=A0A317W5C0_9EURO|nr:hypothetical protein BO94DRAFT_587925 [Aspergillus sclerotioniger CBS 115572]PWY79340.1 hypothetical protein BO94DRAFT_587925 [Aspergillus sclerotioniger CBS 115572]
MHSLSVFLCSSSGLPLSTPSTFMSVAGRVFDYVVAGGGLTGLKIAGRLMETSPATVLVIEAGYFDSDRGAFITNLTEYAKAFDSSLDQAYKLFGLNSWETVFGNKGWNWGTLSRYIKRAERAWLIRQKKQSNLYILTVLGQSLFRLFSRCQRYIVLVYWVVGIEFGTHNKHKYGPGQNSCAIPTAEAGAGQGQAIHFATFNDTFGNYSQQAHQHLQPENLRRWADATVTQGSEQVPQTQYETYRRWLTEDVVSYSEVLLDTNGQIDITARSLLPFTRGSVHTLDRDPYLRWIAYDSPYLLNYLDSLEQAAATKLARKLFREDAMSRVYGVERLRVVDASLAPTQLSSHRCPFFMAWRRILRKIFW